MTVALFSLSRCVCLCVCELVVRTCIGGRLAFQILSFGLERSRNRKEGSKKGGREKEGKGGKSLELTSPFIRETDWESLKRYQQGLSIPEPPPPPFCVEKRLFAVVIVAISLPPPSDAPPPPQPKTGTGLGLKLCTHVLSRQL